MESFEKFLSKRIKSYNELKDEMFPEEYKEYIKETSHVEWRNYRRIYHKFYSRKRRRAEKKLRELIRTAISSQTLIKEDLRIIMNAEERIEQARENLKNLYNNDKKYKTE